MVEDQVCAARILILEALVAFTLLREKTELPGACVGLSGNLRRAQVLLLQSGLHKQAAEFVMEARREFGKMVAVRGYGRRPSRRLELPV